MTLKAYIVAGDASTPVEADGVVLEETLGSGPDGKQIAAQVGEVMAAIADSVRPRLQAPAEIVLEISGSLTLKAEGGVKWLLISIGGGTDKVSSFKCTLKTTVAPEAASPSPPLMPAAS